MGCPRGSAFLLPSRVSDPRRFVPVPFFLFESDPNPKYWRQQEFLKKNSRYLVATAKCGVYLLSRMRLFDMTWLAGGNHLMVWDNAPPPPLRTCRKCHGGWWWWRYYTVLVSMATNGKNASHFLFRHILYTVPMWSRWYVRYGRLLSANRESAALIKPEAATRATPLLVASSGSRHFSDSCYCLQRN